MKKISQKDKNKLAKKLLKFKRKGLVSYRDYLKSQLKSADNKKRYKKYIKDQLKSNKKKIAAIDLEL